MLDTLFFIASKLFWLVMRPEAMLSLLVVGGAILLHTPMRRLGQRLVVVGAFFVVVLNVYPLWRPLMVPLEQAYAPNPDLTRAPAGIIVLGGAEVADVTSVWAQPQVNTRGERFIEAVALAHRFPEAKLIFTGGSGSLRGGLSGVEVAQMIFTGAGIAPERMVFEPDSRNTAENAAFLKAQLGEGMVREAGPWILVTSAFHMPRSVATFCATGWTDLVPWPVDFRTGGRLPGFATNLDYLNVALKEWIGMLAYRATGRAQVPDDTDPCLAQMPEPVVVSSLGGSVMVLD